MTRLRLSHAALWLAPLFLPGMISAQEEFSEPLFSEPAATITLGDVDLSGDVFPESVEPEPVITDPNFFGQPLLEPTTEASTEPEPTSAEGTTSLDTEGTALVEPGLEIAPGGMAGTSIPKAIEEVMDSAIFPSWMNNIADDNALLWREHRNDWEIIPRDGDGMGFTTLNMSSNIATDDGTSGVWLTPRFGWTFVSGPITPDVRPQLYDLRLELNFATQLNQWWDVHLQIAPTFATDWDNKSDDGFRLIGGGLLANHINDQLSAVGGVMFLDRHDIPILPLGGFRWRPSEWLEFDAVIPSPRASLRYHCDEKKSNWLYCGGQLGGGAWAIDHSNGLNDQLAYRDFRVVLGLETRKINGERNVFEAGYVFERELDFRRVAGDQNLDGTAVIRWGQLY